MSNNYNNQTPSNRPMVDPIDHAHYTYNTRDAKEERLYQAMQMALNDECPPDTKDYLCKASEDEGTEAETCAKCFERWATRPFGEVRK